MYSIETFNIVDRGQYKSISNIERLNSCLIKMDYEYRLNLQTVSHLSNTVDIYLDKNELQNSLIDPITEILKNKSLVLETTIKNMVNPVDIAYYKFPRMLHSDFLFDLIKFHGCNYQLKLNYRMEDRRFLIIESSVVFKSLLFKHSPEEIQPASIRLSIDEAENFLGILNCL